MLRKLIPLLAIIFSLTLVSTAFPETEEEIIARYLKKAEKQRKQKIYSVSLSFSYGRLHNRSDYNLFYNYANLNISPGDPLVGIWRSKQFGAEFGMMVARNVALKLGFEYWLKLGNSTIGDYSMSITPLGTQEDFELNSEVKVYGVTGGIDYHLLNPPDENGIVHLPGVRVGLGAGFYSTTWDLWDGSNTFNLETENLELNSEPLKATAPGLSVWLGLDYPVGIFGLLAGVDVQYLYLNFDNVKVYNNVGEELYVSYSDNVTDRVGLDFSGPRGKVELKRYFRW